MTLGKSQKRTEQQLPRAVVLTSQSIVWRKVHSHLANVREHEHPQRTIYHAGVPSDANIAWEIVLAEINVGNNSAAFETERAVNHFQPELVFFVGLAGGNKFLAASLSRAARRLRGRGIEPRP